MWWNGRDLSLHQEMDGERCGVRTCVCVCVNVTQPLKRNENLPFATTWVDLEGIMLSEVSQTEEDTVYFH